MPIDDVVIHSADAPAVTQVILIASFEPVEAMYPPVPIVVDNAPINICCPAFCAIFQPPAVYPLTAIVSPRIGLAGSVKVVKFAGVAFLTTTP